MYRELLKKYLDDLASRKPAPGGGSAAALTGALGAALMSKVANFTIGKEKYKHLQTEMRKILQRSEDWRESFNHLCAEDARAYQKFAKAFELPKRTPAEKQKRAKRIQEALTEATTVPLQICKEAQQAIKLCLPLAQKGNTNLISDTGIASRMLNCAFQSALLNVEINLKSIKDDKFILKTREMLKPMKKEVEAINQKVNSEVEKYLGGMK
ncbi:MAG: cyclodeaminase/cyclohydrolase family protein [Omnitrophica bacterium]|nr:cyclodeaminase/cyclohydrolase family protein [Candidatus Omnitrophota bacterium]